VANEIPDHEPTDEPPVPLEDEADAVEKPATAESNPVDAVVARPEPDSQPDADSQSEPAATHPTDRSPLIPLQAVPEAPSPFRFDLKAVFGLMALCCVQFALVNYFGALIGLLAGIGVCLIVLTSIILTAILLAKSQGAAWMELLDRLAIRLSVGVVVLFFAMIFAGGGSIAFTQYIKYSTTVNLQNDLGFNAMEQYVDHGQYFNSAPVITRIEPGGLFDKAGVKRDDVLIIDSTEEDFYLMLEENRGKQVTINIAVDGANGSLDTATQKAVTITIPKH